MVWWKGWGREGDPWDQYFTEMFFPFTGSFSAVFVDQTYWQTGVSGKPSHSVWGFLTGGLIWFALPFSAAFAFGMSYWAMSIKAGGHLLSDDDALKGNNSPMYVVCWSF